MMTTPFAQIAAYMDRLHDDVGMMIKVVEHLMGEAGYEPFARCGNQACWQLSSHWAYPERWRAHYIVRVYVPTGQDMYDSIVAIMVQFEHDTAYDFPPLVCARYYHEPLSDADVYARVFKTDQLRSLSRDGSFWTSLRVEGGWVVAEPAFAGPIHRIKGYILNPFDIVDRQSVLDNIVRPLTRPGVDLDGLLTVARYPFGGMDAPGAR